MLAKDKKTVDAGTEGAANPSVVGATTDHEASTKRPLEDVSFAGGLHRPSSTAGAEVEVKRREGDQAIILESWAQVRAVVEDLVEHGHTRVTIPPLKEGASPAEIEVRSQLKDFIKGIKEHQNNREALMNHLKTEIGLRVDGGAELWEAAQTALGNKTVRAFVPLSAGNEVSDEAIERRMERKLDGVVKKDIEAGVTPRIMLDEGTPPSPKILERLIELKQKNGADIRELTPDGIVKLKVEDLLGRLESAGPEHRKKADAIRRSIESEKEDEKEKASPPSVWSRLSGFAVGVFTGIRNKVWGRTDASPEAEVPVSASAPVVETRTGPDTNPDLHSGAAVGGEDPVAREKAEDPRKAKQAEREKIKAEKEKFDAQVEDLDARVANAKYENTRPGRAADSKVEIVIEPGEATTLRGLRALHAAMVKYDDRPELQVLGAKTGTGDERVSLTRKDIEKMIEEHPENSTLVGRAWNTLGSAVKFGFQKLGSVAEGWMEKRAAAKERDTQRREFDEMTKDLEVKVISTGLARMSGQTPEPVTIALQSDKATTYKGLHEIRNAMARDGGQGDIVVTMDGRQLTIDHVTELMKNHPDRPKALRALDKQRKSDAEPVTAAETE